MKTSEQFYELARRRMRQARECRALREPEAAAALAAAARSYVRTGRTWEHILEQPPREPLEAQLALVARIQPYRPGIDFTP